MSLLCVQRDGEEELHAAFSKVLLQAVLTSRQHLHPHHCYAGGSTVAEQPFQHLQPSSLPGLCRVMLAEEGPITL